MYQIRGFGIVQTSKFVAVLYFVFFAIFAVPGTIVGILFAILRKEPAAFSALLFLILPVVYGALGFLMTALMCWVYNVVAARIGGIELDLQQK